MAGNPWNPHEKPCSNIEVVPCNIDTTMCRKFQNLQIDHLKEFTPQENQYLQFPHHLECTVGLRKSNSADINKKQRKDLSATETDTKCDRRPKSQDHAPRTLEKEAQKYCRNRYQQSVIMKEVTTQMNWTTRYTSYAHLHHCEDHIIQAESTSLITILSIDKMIKLKSSRFTPLGMGMHPMSFCEVETDASYLKLTSESLVLPLWTLDSAKLLLSDLILSAQNTVWMPYLRAE